MAATGPGDSSPPRLGMHDASSHPVPSRHMGPHVMTPVTGPCTTVSSDQDRWFREEPGFGLKFASRSAAAGPQAIHKPNCESVAPPPSNLTDHRLSFGKFGHELGSRSDDISVAAVREASRSAFSQSHCCASSRTCS